MKITFLGATGTVTGSKYLIEHNSRRVLIDCGLFQGRKELRLRNWEKLPVEASSIDAIILTHAHLDHSGYIPLLVKQGFTGKIFCSPATFDLCKILLPDSGYIQEEDALRANRYNYSKHHPALPLYSKEEAENSLQFFYPVSFGKPHYIGDDLHFTFSRSGHILGSAFITLSTDRKTMVFSGDLGRPDDSIMAKPAILQDADYIVVESTYGNQVHPKTSPVKELEKIINKTTSHGGSVLIPAFAVGRAQNILYYLYELKSKGSITNIPIFLDSPMAINVTGLLHKYRNEHRLPEKLCHAVCDVATYVRTVDDSKELDHLSMPCVIISASGMATGGRVLHHLKYFMQDAKNTILFAGFQAGGTRGDRMVRGEKEIKIHGQYYPLRAKVENLSNVSAHADYEEILNWLGNFRKKPIKIFVTHGEEEAAHSMRTKIIERFGWTTEVPEYLESVEL